MKVMVPEFKMVAVEAKQKESLGEILPVEVQIKFLWPDIVARLFVM